MLELGGVIRQCLLSCSWRLFQLNKETVHAPGNCINSLQIRSLKPNKRPFLTETPSEMLMFSDALSISQEEEVDSGVCTNRRSFA